MTEEFRYRPPSKYLFVGLSSLVAATMFGMPIVVGGISVGFAIAMVFFCLLMLALGIGFLSIFIREFNIGKLVISDDFIEIPGRWKKRRRFNYDEIIDIIEYETYDHIIELESSYYGRYMIERNFMKKKDFYEVRSRLMKYWTNGRVGWSK